MEDCDDEFGEGIKGIGFKLSVYSHKSKGWYFSLTIWGCKYLNVIILSVQWHVVVSNTPVTVTLPHHYSEAEWENWQWLEQDKMDFSEFVKESWGDTKWGVAQTFQRRQMLLKTNMGQS